MSKINRIRIMNLNYNNNSIRIDDETFDLNGETTLLSLRNGGGKTVLVQIIMSLFVNKGSRDFADRPFRSYFTTSQPTFVLVEWKLDHEQGYFLTGMMVRKSQNSDENQNENNNEGLDMINFTGSYERACDYTLDTLAVIENQGNSKKLKGFGECKSLFESLKTNHRTDFNYYDMYSPYSRRQYFSKLKEYQIDHREWEGIMKKVNLKESGLSELFSNAKDEKGLIENWFIDAIERKLNGEQNKIKEFQKLGYKLIRQYRDNESSIKRKQVIEQFFEDGKLIDKQLEVYLEKQKEFDEQTGILAAFAKAIGKSIQALQQDIILKKEEVVKLQEELLQILKEKYSYQICQAEEERNVLGKQRSDMETQITGMAYEAGNMEKEICRYECAGLYAEMQDFENEIARINEKINIITEEKRDHKEEMEQIGAALFLKFTEEYQKTAQRLEASLENIRELSDQKGEYLAEREILTEELNDLKRQQGQLEQCVIQYDDREERFNKRYGAAFTRNILGIYEEGSLPLIGRQYEDEYTNTKAAITRLTEKIHSLRGEKESLEDKLRQNTAARINLQNKMGDWEKRQKKFLEEKNIRLVYMQYVEAMESELDQKAVLLNRFDKKINDLELQKGEFLDEKKAVKKEYQNLKQGKVIELPENIINCFEEENISYIYGMEWLKNNGRSVQENQKLVEKNPFLPYCIIVDGETANRMRYLKDEVYTEFPIPIIRRERLESAIDAEDGYVHLDQIDFFVMFNRHLLDLDELNKILEQKKQLLEDCEDKICRKTEEIETYREYRTTIDRQEFSGRGLQELQDALEKAKADLKNLSGEYAEYQQKKKEKEEESDKLQKEIDAKKQTETEFIHRLEEFKELEKEYENYIVNLNQKSRNEKKQRENEDRAKKIEKALQETERQLEQETEKKKNCESDKKDNRIQLENYRNYDGIEAGGYKEKEVPDLKARYEALTSKISENLEELNKQLNAESRRYERKRHHLEQKNIYQFEIKEFADLKVTDTILPNLKETLRDLQRRQNEITNQVTKLEKDITEKAAELRYLHKELFEKTGRDELVEKSQIKEKDFDAVYKLKNYDKRNLEQEIKNLENRQNYLESAGMSLTEYADVQTEMESPQIDIMTEDELRAYQKEQMLRLRETAKRLETEQKETDKILRNLSAKEEYQEDFFSKSFAGLISLSAQGYSLKEQLDTYYQTYDSMLKKLQIDLDNIEKERKNVEEIFLEYIQSVDENLRMIDRNSTITIRGRNLKMLRINVPDWESSREYYQMKLTEYVESFLKRGMEAVENSENVEEVLGKIITTKRLYDEIVGISNIAIKMYKIEAEREVLISWSEVSANSGGEGFLSAFVILSCLLSYMRKDDADLFATGEEGKVLIMDNPFAQTNAAHLLKPLMDIAKKTNTQLICLSGLGGDSIYNRFDNIYVLKLINSNLKQGKQYMSSEHLKGEDIKKMQLSQFVVEEQMSLFEM